MERASSLSLLRQIYRELRRTLSMGQKHVYDSQHWKFIIASVRNTRDLESSHEEARRLSVQGQNFLQYLESTRQYEELLEKYKGKGERDPGDLAQILGFKMPHEPKEPRRPKEVHSESCVGEKSSKSSQ